MEEGIAETVTRLVLGLAIILFAAKLGGEVAQRFLRQPSVLGELLSGIIIGPYALGALSIPGIGALFPLPHGAEAASFLSVSQEIWSFAQVAAIILLFVAGLETDLRQFLKFAPRAILVAAGGLLQYPCLGLSTKTMQMEPNGYEPHWELGPTLENFCISPKEIH